jgi:hypothetical protein
LAETSLADLVVTLSAQLDDSGFKDLGASISELEAQGMSLTEALASIEAQLAPVGTAAEAASEQLNLFDESMQISYADATGQLNLFATELEPIAGAAAEVTPALENLSEETKHVGEEAEAGGEGLHKFLEFVLELSAAAGLSMGIAELAKEAGELFATVQKATISLTALTGSSQQAEETIERLKDMSLATATSFEELVSETQRMTAQLQGTGVTAEEIQAALHGAAETAAATGRPFEGIATALQRITVSGMVTGRTMLALGINTQDLAKAMGVASDEVSKAFKALDESDRLDKLTEAMQRYDGTAEKIAASSAGTWKNLWQQIEFFLEELGKLTVPVLTPVVDFFSKLTGSITTFIGWVDKGMVSWKNFLQMFVGGTGGAIAASIDMVDKVVNKTTLDMTNGFAGAKTHLDSVSTAINHVADDFEQLKKHTPFKEMSVDAAVLVEKEKLLASAQSAVIKAMAESGLDQTAFWTKQVNDAVDQMAEAWASIPPVVRTAADDLRRAIVVENELSAAMVDADKTSLETINDIGDHMGQLVAEQVADNQRIKNSHLDLFQTIYKEGQKAFVGIENGLINSLTHWTGFVSAIKGMFQTLGTDVLRIVLGQMLAPIEAGFARYLTTIVAHIMGVKTAQEAADAASLASGVALRTNQVIGEGAVASAKAMAAYADIPFIGEALGAAAAAAEMAAITPLIGLAAAQGGFDVKKETLTMLHPDEMVLPADLATGLRNVIGTMGGDDNRQPTGHYFDMRGSSFGAGLNDRSVSDMMQRALRNLKLAAPARVPSL